MSARQGLALLSVALAIGCGAPSGRAEFAQPEAQLVTAALITEHASIQPGGSTRVGIHFDIEPGWHIYADPPGDAGMATTIQWAEFPGLHVGPIQWPTPEEFVDPGDIRTRGYSGATVLAQQITLITRETPVVLPLQATVKWLACRDVCIPGSAQLELALPVSGRPPVASAHAELFDHTGG